MSEGETIETNSEQPNIAAEKETGGKNLFANFKMEFTPSLKWTCWIVYSLLVLSTTAAHEPWRDEAQSWLIARDLSLTQLFKYLPYEGHPPLWFLILMPFAKAGFPYVCAGFLNNLISLAFAWLLLFKNRLNPFLSVTLLFSYYFAYEYAVIARNYSIVGLLLVCVGTLYEKRFEKPFLYATVIFLLFQTNVMVFCTGVALGAIFFLEIVEKKNFKRVNFIALSIMVSGGLFTIALLLGAGMKSGFSQAAADKASAVFNAFSNALFVDTNEGSFALLVYLIIVLSFIRRPYALLFLVISLTGFVCLIAFTFQGFPRHHGFLLTFLLGAYLIASFYEPLKPLEKYKWIDLIGVWVFVFLLLIQDFQTFGYAIDENRKNFSDSENAAKFITKNGLTNYTIVGHQSYAASSVLPYLPRGKKFWYVDQLRYGTFVRWDTVFLYNTLNYRSDYAPYIVSQKFPKQDSILLLLNSPLQLPQFQQQWQLIYQTTEQPITADEIYFIYKHVP